MKNRRIFRLAIAILLAPPFTSLAMPPSRSVRESCVLDHSNSSSVHLDRFPTDIFYEQENYADGYDATYLFLDGDKEIGYAENAQTNALIYSGRIYQLAYATPTPSSLKIAAEFSPALAAWSKITAAQQSYICVSFNFDGLGHSGTFQNFRGAFLLDINVSKPQLYYAEGDVRKITSAKRKSE